jgi:uncharacterized protein
MTGAASRIATLDIIRGVAVMGILTMNIVAFAMPEAAYMNPAAYGAHNAADYATWAMNFVLFDGKMRGLFSFLFGASTLLVIERATAAGENPARVHFSRMAWLFVFGMAHLYLIWWGDILQHYAVMGAITFFFRKMPVEKLLALAVCLIVFEFVLLASVPFQLMSVRSDVLALHPAAGAIQAYQQFRASYGRPGMAFLAQDLGIHRSGYWTIVTAGLPDAQTTPIQTFLSVGPETLAYMLLGMAGLKSGFLTGEWSREHYRHWAKLGFLIGVPIYALLALFVAARGFSMIAVIEGALIVPVLVRPVMIVGWASLIILLARPGGALSARIAAAGRMAFSNYLLTSLLCTSLFYGYGLGWYGHFSRAAVYPIVVAIWLLMLLWSRPWLAHFRYGPLEWLWRSLSRFGLQPMQGAASN